ncbi:MAG: protein kinase domain-containing protein [Bryobacteraceae bacterium]
MEEQVIGRYQVVELLKDGHFAATFKAREPDSDEKVVVKLFKPAALAEPARFDRLKKDALRASALNHPNLAAIIEFGEQEGRPYLVTPFVPGESLEATLKRKRLRRKETISYSQQILSAMEALEAAGLAHGDLRPSHVMVAIDGRLRVTGTGLARLVEGFEYSATSQPPGATPETTAYLAPEVIEGQSPDTITDIFSFGALFYHMASGRSPFKRDWVVAVLDSILKEDPRPPETVSSHTPKGSDKVVARCLEKDREKRAAAFADVRLLVEKLRIDYVSTTTAKRTFKVESWERLLRTGLIALVTLIVVGGALMWWQSRPKDTTVSTGLHLVTTEGGLDTDPAASPKGDRVVFSSDRSGDGHLDLWIQPINEKKATRLTRHTADDREPAFSPDGKWIAFRSERDEGGVYLIPTAGGTERLIAPGGRRPRFSPDGSLIAYWTGPAGLSPDIMGDYKVFVVSAQGGEPRRLVPEFAAARFPVWAPDGKHVLVLGKMTPSVDSGLSDWWMAPIDGTGPVRTDACQSMRSYALLPQAQCAIPGDWKGDRVIFSIPETNGAHLYQARFNVTQPRIGAPPQRLTDGDRLHIQPSLTAEGQFVFTSESLGVGVFSLALKADEGRTVGELQPMVQGNGHNTYPTLSENDKKLVFLSNRGGSIVPWIRDLDTLKDVPVTDARQEQSWPRISPDGSKVAFSEQKIGRYEQFVAPLGEGPVQLACQDCGGALVYDWTRDSARLLVDYHPASAPYRGVAIVNPEAGARQPLLLDPQNPVTQARLSPDGRHVVFVMRMQSGRSQIHLAPFREGLVPRSEWVPVTDGKTWDTSPQWSPGGTLIYYMSNRDSSRCAWAQKLDGGFKPEGVPFVVYHFHSARRSPALTGFNGLDLFVSRNRLLISLGEITGSIWTGRTGS